MRVASLFSGIGGFEKGILQADQGAEIVFSSEFDPDSKAKYINNQPARMIYKKNYGVEPHGDITKIKSTDVPDHDILVGGPPCQGFSIAGKREGLCGAKGSMFYEFIRIARDKQPMLLLIENVKGILSSGGGWDFAKILIELEDAGYWIEWQVLNSKNHGVPQNRERVFIIGHSRNGSIRKIFPIGKSSEMVDEQEPTVYCLDANYYKGPAQQSRTMIKVNNPIHSKNRIYDPVGLSPTINCAEGGGRQPIILCDSGQGRKNQLRNETIPPLRANTGAGHNNVVCHSTLPRSSESKEGGTGHLQRDDGLSYCCDANNNIAVEQPITTCIRAEHHNTADVHFIPENHNRIRRLMPTECEKLQGFPSGWTAEGIDDKGNIVKIADTNRYKCLGNAVTVNVIEFIFRHIMEAVE